MHAAAEYRTALKAAARADLPSGCEHLDFDLDCLTPEGLEALERKAFPDLLILPPLDPEAQKTSLKTGINQGLAMTNFSFPGGIADTEK